MNCDRDRSTFIDTFSLLIRGRFQLMRSSQGKIRRNTRLKVVLLLSPIFIFLMAFFAFPFVITIAYSFGQVDNFNRLIAVTFNLNYYAKALSVTPLYIVAKSLWIAAVTTVLCLAMGYPVAYWIGVKAGRLKNLAVLLLIIPFWSSFLIRTYGWQVSRFISRCMKYFIKTSE